MGSLDGSDVLITRDRHWIILCALGPHKQIQWGWRGRNRILLVPQFFSIYWRTFSMSITSRTVPEALFLEDREQLYAVWWCICYWNGPSGGQERWITGQMGFGSVSVLWVSPRNKKFNFLIQGFLIIPFPQLPKKISSLILLLVLLLESNSWWIKRVPIVEQG